MTELPNSERVNGKKSQQLPSYELATTLPTYEDVQEMKEDEARSEVVEMLFGNVCKLVNSFFTCHLFGIEVVCPAVRL